MLLVTAITISLTACGFQLRGKGETELWPSRLKQLQLRLDSSAGDVFQEALRDSLINSYQVEIANASAPVLIVTGVSRERRVLSLSATGKASEYLIRFRANFRVLDKNGNELLALRSLQLQRDFSFGAANLLAKEAEEQRIYDEMQEEAARQLLRRVATLMREKKS